MANRPNKRSAGDLTGNRLAEAQAEAIEAQKDRSAELAMATAAKQQVMHDGVFDPATGEQLNADEIGEVEDLTVQVLDDEDAVIETDVEVLDDEPQVVARISEDVKFCLGQDVWFDLKGGHKYKLPVSTVNYLDEKGLVWH